MTARSKDNPSRRRFGVLAWLIATCLGLQSAYGFIGEPETVIYGRIFNYVNPNVEQLVTDGELRWLIQKPDGSFIELSGSVEELAGGAYSYSLRVPHQAVMLGESPSAQAVPLGAVGETAYHTGITVNGDPAGILPPATSGFELDQLLRASAVRIDLGIDGEQVDSDGDGMPDWWEDQHGLDKQDGSDALTDLNGDGTSNLDSYLAGVDPQRDVTEPLLLTSEITVYANATSLVPLEVEDVDSSPDQLTFMVYSLPVGGELRLRNAQVLPGSTDQVVQVGDTFTLADVRSGRLVLSHPGSESVGPFEVGVRDEDPSHEESRGQVAVRIFESSPESLAVTSSEKVRFQAHQLVTDLDHLVVDFGGRPGKHFQSLPSSGLNPGEYESHMESYGPAHAHVLLGGPGDDVLTGGAANDFLLGDQGVDRMTGGFGADSFLFISESDDVDSISDYSPDEGDVIDVAALLEGTSELLTDYVRIRRSGGDALLEVDADGVGADFSDLTVRLEDSSLEAGDVENLYYAGNLEAGSVVLPPRISVALGSSASENGPTAGHFVLFREGALDGDVTVAIQLSGNATNGADYELIHGTVLMPDGVSSLNVAVSPYVDPTVEFNEVVHLSLVSSADYLIGAASSAQMTIEDLKPQLSLEVLEPLASVDEGAAAAVLMRREGLVSSEVFVQFDLEGTAVNGTDYDYISPFVSFGAGQTTKLVVFNPKSNVDFSGAEAKTIRMSLKPDVAYAMPVPMASVMLVPKRLTYQSWLAENGLSAGGGDEASQLMMYAFSLDSSLPHAPVNLARLPRPDLEADHLTIRFRRKPGISDYIYQVEYSEDLVNWDSGPGVVEDITHEIAPDDPGAAVYRSARPISETSKGMMRVNIIPKN